MSGKPALFLRSTVNVLRLSDGGEGTVSVDVTALEESRKNRTSSGPVGGRFRCPTSMRWPAGEKVGATQ